MQVTSPTHLRKVYFDAWHKALLQQPLSSLERIIVEAIKDHPEYHDFFAMRLEEAEQKISQFPMSQNPFFHLGLHIAIIEQVSANKPLGIQEIYFALLKKSGDKMHTEHKMMETLADLLYKGARQGLPVDDETYLEGLKRL